MYQIRCAFLFVFMAMCATPAMAATARAAQYLAPNTYENMYPYMNNSMRTNLNSGQTPSRDNAQINVLTRTYQMPNTTARRVVSRPTARRVTSNNTTAARSATVARSGAAVATTNTRRVVPRTNAARSGTNTGAMRVSTNAANVARATRANNTTINRTSTLGQDTSVVRTSSARCLADYTDCMNSYCERKNTAYNRCYCSAKLSQIDATYKPAIDNLIQQILTLKNNNQWTQAEMDEYWMETVGKYTGENSWAKLDDALDIDWAGTESRVRGQNAFSTGHEYCSQHLRGCFYMAGNLRDAYRSEINRDCAVYESSLQRLKSAAESVVGSYQ